MCTTAHVGFYVCHDAAESVARQTETNFLQVVHMQIFAVFMSETFVYECTLPELSSISTV